MFLQKRKFDPSELEQEQEAEPQDLTSRPSQLMAADYSIYTRGIRDGLDLSEWRDHRVLAKQPDGAYYPGVIKLTNAAGEVRVQLDNDVEVRDDSEEKNTKIDYFGFLAYCLPRRAGQRPVRRDWRCFAQYRAGFGRHACGGAGVARIAARFLAGPRHPHHHHPGNHVHC